MNLPKQEYIQLLILGMGHVDKIADIEAEWIKHIGIDNLENTHIKISLGNMLHSKHEIAFVYGIYNKELKKIAYIGSSTNPERRLREHISKYGEKK